VTAERPVDFQKIRNSLQDFDLRSVFVEGLGWSSPPRALEEATVVAAGVELRRRPIAVLSGFVVWEIETADGSIPDAGVRAAVHKVKGAVHHEHVLVFVDRGRQKSVWSWVHRHEGRDLLRAHAYFRGQPGDLFISKLGVLMFDLQGFDDQGNVAVVEVANRVRAGLDVEKVVKKFYADLQDQHPGFLGCGVAEEQVSILLSRIMFIYFLQRNGFLDGGNRAYLEDKLAWSRRALGEDRYFTEFLVPLLFEGFYGGLFLRHRVTPEDRAIDVPDAPFERLFAFFADYDFCLDDTPSGEGRPINPDVLGYIGGDTRPEIAEWLCEESIHRRVLDRVNELGGSVAGARFEEMSDLLLDLTPSLCRTLLDTVLPGISILDPACGSGTFLVGALRVMLGIYGAVVGAAKTLPDRALRDEIRGWEGRASLAYSLKKRILASNLFGVDPREEVAEVARLRLFLSLVASASREESPEPLANVDLNVTVGDAPVAEVLGARRGFDVVVTDAASSSGEKRATTAHLREVFVERCYGLLRDGGQFGLVLPAGIYKDEGTRGLRKMLLDDCALRSLFGLRVRPSGRHEPGALCLVVGRRGGRTERFFVAFGDVSKRSAAEVAELLRDHEAPLCITSDFVRQSSPRSLAVLEIDSELDLVPLEKLVRLPRLREASAVEMGLGVQLEPQRADVRKGPRAPLGPVYAAHAIQSYAWHAEMPRLTLAKGATVHRLGFLTKRAPDAYVLAFRNVAQASEGRLVQAALIPPGVVVDASVTVLWLRPPEHGSKLRGQRLAADLLYLLALFNGYPLDWMVRMRGSRHILVSQILELPVPCPAPAEALFRSVVQRAARLTCTTPAFDDLARNGGLKSHKDGVTVPEARAWLRAEIDGLVAHLYGLTEDEFAHILKTFAMVPEPVKVAAHNAYRAVARGDLP
jgi:SAM-dependent methyltransferase